MITRFLRRRNFLTASFATFVNEASSAGQRSTTAGLTQLRVAPGEGSLCRLEWWRKYSGATERNSNTLENTDSVSEDKSARNESARLLNSLNAYDFQNQLRELSEERSNISYSELLKLAEEKGVAADAKESRRLCDTLIAMGTLFRYRDIVYLKTEEVADLIKSCLPNTLAETQQLITRLEQELEPLAAEKKEIEQRAERTTNMVLMAGLVYLVVRFAVLFRFTFWEFSWDVIEPVSYFLTLFDGMLVYAFFLWKRQDFEFSSIRGHFQNRYAELSQKYDAEKYEKLLRKVKTYRRFVSRHFS